MPEKIISTQPYSVTYDLHNCDREPLHLIQHLQAHACLVACMPETLEILHATTNTAEHLGHACTDLYGSHLSALLLQTHINELLAAASQDNLLKAPVRTAFRPDMHWMNCLAHLHNGLLLIEFEPAGHPDQSLHLQQGTVAALHLMQQETNLSQLFRTAAAQVKQLSGYDRVMVYRFDGEGHGEVVGEAREPHLEPFLGCIILPPIYQCRHGHFLSKIRCASSPMCWRALPLCTPP